MRLTLQQVRDRKLVQWAVTYLAGAWALLEVLDLLSQYFGWPDALVRSAIVLLAIGFIGALVIAYYHGERGRQRVSGTELLMLTALFAIAGASIAMVGRPEPSATALRRAASPTLLRLSFTLPGDQFLPVGSSFSVLELSAQGTQLVYLGQEGRETQLYLRDLGDFKVRALPGTRGAREPFFSPDGRWIGFFADDKLKKVAIADGIPIDLTETSGRPYGASWGADNTIVYSLSTSSLWRVSADGGAAVELPLYTMRNGVREPAAAPVKWPRFLPGSKRALAGVGWLGFNGQPNQAGIIGVVELETGEFRPLFEGSRPHYLPTGHIIFDAGVERISMVPFSVSRLRTTGPAVPIVENALRSPGSGTNFSASTDGKLAYPTGGFERTLVIVDRYGREKPLGVAPRGYRMPEASPDGRLLAVTVDPQPPHIWIIDLQTERATTLTHDGYNLFADWSRDGRELIFNRLDVEKPGLYRVRWPQADSLTYVPATNSGMAARWARPGQIFVKPPDRWDLQVLDLRSGALTNLLATSADERSPDLSPDGNWIAYTSDATGVEEVYVIPYADRAAPVAVSQGGGTDPRWSRAGDELFFRGDNTIFAVKVRTTPTFAVTGPVERLFTSPYDFSNPLNWDVLPRDQFLMVKSSPNQGREIRFVVNWLQQPPR